MRNISVTICAMVIGLCLINSPVVLAECPSADLTGDCIVDFNDFAVMANQWLDEGEPLPVLNGMTWVSISDDGAGMKDGDGNPIYEGGFTGEMSKYETTNAQYCEYLNAAKASGDVVISGGEVNGSGGPYDGEIYYDMDDSDAQISWNGSQFYVETRDSNDMSNHPVAEVSWYGATAFCNYYGYRLPTEWEWQAVADYDGSYTYGCGTTIDHSKANYDFENPLNFSNYPYTSPVDYYSSYGYGMNDMAGNVWEWTSSVSGSYRVLRGGGCTVSRYNTDNGSNAFRK